MLSGIPILRWLFFGAISPVMRLGVRRPLEPADMPQLPSCVAESIVAPETHFGSSGPWTFVASILQPDRWRIARSFLLMLLRSLTQLATPLLVFQLITVVRQASEGSLGLAQGLLLAAAVACVPMVGGLIAQHYFYQILLVEMRVAARINLALMRHALRVSQTERAKRQIGDLVNHVGVDTEAIAFFPMMACEIVASILLMAGGAAVLVMLVGWSAAGAVPALLMLVPLTRWAAPNLTRIYRLLLEASDARVTLISQILRGIRVVKYFCWGPGMASRVNAIRARELLLRRRQVLLFSVTNLSFSLMPTLVIVTVLLVHMLRGFSLDAATVFSCVSVVGLLTEPLGHITYQINQMLTNKVSADRLAAFLRMGNGRVAGPSCLGSGLLQGLRFHNAKVQFDGSASPAIADLSLEIHAGESVAVVGPVASGKSTLLLSVLGEVPLAAGTVDILGRPSLGWVPQEPFVMNATFRENILMGGKGDGLPEVLEDCALAPDLAALPGGLDTELGDHGVNLSGGQKQRLALARAAMGNPDLILLDDPLSAVDPETENHLVDRLLFGRWKGATRVVATHRLGHLRRFSKVVFLKEGRIHGVGTFQELVNDNAEFRSFVAETEKVERAAAGAMSSHGAVVVPEVTGEKSHRITDDEDREMGAVRASVYWEYLKALGGRTHRRRNLFLLALGVLLPSLMFLVQDSWFAVWLNRRDGLSLSLPFFSHLQLPPDSLGGLGVYALLAATSVALQLWGSFFGGWRAVDSGRILHEDAFGAVLRAPMRFFDSTPPGRILNRFSGDISNVENRLVEAFFGFVFSLARVVFSLALAMTLLPAMLLVLPPMAFLYYWAQKIYRSSAREAKRLDSIAKSPRFNHFKETLEGLAVVRAFERQPHFLAVFQDKVEHGTRMLHASILMNRWFSSRVPVLSGGINLALACVIVIAAREGGIQAGTAGLVLSISLSFTEVLNWTIRAFSDLESNLTSVERLGHFARIPSEPDITRPAALVPGEKWPIAGRVEFRQVQARYAPHLPLVLRGVSFEIPAGHKAGVVGRTGSGKSTLFQALFRFIEIEQGEILVDGKDIAGIPLEVLRRAIAIIPQDPTLFVGTVKSNLDQFGLHSHGELEAVLRRVHLWEAIARLPGGVEAEVQENGANFSQGQRQLLCLARAFLDDVKLIVLDEATASVDVQTDALVQRALREECAGITVITIAHRLGTLSDYDQVIELEDGKVVGQRQ